MAEFVVNTDVLRSEADNLQSLQRELNSVALRLAAIQISNALRSGVTAGLNRNIQDCRTAVSNQASNLQKLSGGLDSVARLYDITEKNLSDPKASAQTGNGQADNPIQDIIDRFADIIHPDGWRRDWPFLTILNLVSVLGTAGGPGSGGNSRGFGLPEKWSLLSDKASGSGDLWGIPCSGEAGYSLIGYETDTIAKAKWNLEKGEAGIEYGGKISGHLAKGEASGNIGILGGKADASIGNAAVSGTINATLFEDGKFTPSIGVEAKGEASVLKGDAEGYLGNEDYNAHAKASGTVLGAEAKAEAKAGVITYEDKKTGETVTAYGVKGEVGAEAYVAEGKVSGGFTFMGIDVDVGISGKAGGAGVEAGGSITSNGVSGEIGAGLGLGAGVEISIDWSDFDPPTLEEIGQGIQNVGQSIGEGFQAVGEGIQDVGEAIGEGIQNAGEAIGEGFRNAGEAISDFFNW